MNMLLKGTFRMVRISLVSLYFALEIVLLAKELKRFYLPLLPKNQKWIRHFEKIENINFKI